MPDARPLEECVVDLKAPELEPVSLVDRAGPAKIANIAEGNLPDPKHEDHKLPELQAHAAIGLCGRSPWPGTGRNSVTVPRAPARSSPHHLFRHTPQPHGFVADHNRLTRVIQGTAIRPRRRSRGTITTVGPVGPTEPGGGGSVPSRESDVDESLVAAARERLRAGVKPAVVCGELAARTRRWMDVALAVGQARGIPKADLRIRLGGELVRLQDEFRPGEEEDYGLLLEIHGVFDVPKQLDEREVVIAEHLRTAWVAAGGLGSGHAVSLSRRFVTGELSLAFRTLARSGPRYGPGRPTEFWTAMVAAGELLDPTDGNEHGTVAQVLDESRVRLAECAR
ncbi:hypothetical protein ACFV6G_04990 [Streptomyces lavendulae]|uniref:hypothetical protein n=1 Tax=Streptomyces lavendulae TaxID=1914 RepID=UPI00369E1BAE